MVHIYGSCHSNTIIVFNSSYVVQKAVKFTFLLQKYQRFPRITIHILLQKFFIWLVHKGREKNTYSSYCNRILVFEITSYRTVKMNITVTVQLDSKTIQRKSQYHFPKETRVSGTDRRQFHYRAGASYSWYMQIYIWVEPIQAGKRQRR
jgi:hypothetical protein